MKPQFHHYPARNQFALEVSGAEDGTKHVAHLDYQVRAGVWYLMHTSVPGALRGQGMGKMLVEQVLAFLQSRRYACVPVCSYVVAVAKELAGNERIQGVSGESGMPERRMEVERDTR